MIGLAGLGLLVRKYQRRTGLGMSNQYFALAPGWFVALLVVVIAAIVIDVLVDQPVVVAATAVVVFVAVVVLGRRADTAMRNRLRHGARVVKLSKPTGTGGRAKTWVTLTPAGRKAFKGHLAILQAMAADAKVR